ncbi:MAG TPA: aminotransferase class I/II-fold pyridoxal phosphate-dependent enzyme [Bryobacteraceae bacterium]|nr:aminotransferase class I/II-fold pyridoxal phosphate-dependent enzyme [Bryobacteraceae bacterium]
MTVVHGGDVFAVARAQGWDWREVLDFSANINPLGPSPQVRAAILAAVERIVHYPEREPARLVEALARTWGLDEPQLLVGNGATELIFFLARVAGAMPVTLALPVFSEFHRAFPKARLADLVDPSTWPREGLLVLTRPANPTGWTLPVETLRDYLDSTAASVLVDESFLEFSGLPSAAAMLGQHPRLMVLRSLTKLYALPGLRVGALVGAADAVRCWKKEREPWQVNVLAEEGALAAIGDTEHSDRSLEFVRGERAWLVEQIGRLPAAEALPSDANFVCVRLDYPAGKLCEHLLRRKILIRDCAGWPGVKGDVVRVAVRRREENERLLEVWREFKCD